MKDMEDRKSTATLSCKDRIYIPLELIENKISSSREEKENIQRREHGLGLSLSDGRTGILDLPTCILIDIVRKLRVQDILRCTCVCRVFHQLLKDTYFLNGYQQKSPSIAMVRSFFAPRRHPYSLIEFVDKCNFTRTASAIPANLPEGDLKFTAHCDGLVCLTDKSIVNQTIWICNPITGEFVTLPRINNREINCREWWHQWHGFGFCPSTNHYKYILGTPNLSDSEALANRIRYLDIQIFTVGVDSNWRYLEEDACPYYLDCQGLSYKGAIHWKICRENFHFMHEFIWVFDVTEEKFRSIPTAPYIKNKISAKLDLAVLRDRLSIIQLLGDDPLHIEINIWVMKEYGFVESWSKEYSISGNWITQIRNYRVEAYPCTTWGDRDIIVLMGSNLVSYYHTKKQKFENFKVEGLNSYYDYKEGEMAERYGISLGFTVKAVFSPSFASLKDTLGIEESMMMVQHVQPKELPKVKKELKPKEFSQ